MHGFTLLCINESARIYTTLYKRICTDLHYFLKIENLSLAITYRQSVKSSDRTGN